MPSPPQAAAARCPGRWLAALLLWLGLALSLVGAAQAQGVDLGTLELKRRDGALVLDFSARLTLPAAVEDALKRGVPMYFQAQATVWRSRWYWRDERVARVSRTWRLAYQPLTNTWRVALGGLAQSHATLGEALTVLAAAGGWRLAESGTLDTDARHYVEFSYQLDTSQLPRPMQIGIGGDWALGVERTLKVD